VGVGSAVVQELGKCFHGGLHPIGLLGGSVTLRGDPAIVVAAAGISALAVMGGHCIASPTLSGDSWLLCSLLGSL